MSDKDVAGRLAVSAFLLHRSRQENLWRVSSAKSARIGILAYKKREHCASEDAEAAEIKVKSDSALLFSELTPTS